MPFKALDQSELTTYFNERKTGVQNSWQKAGVPDVIQALSKTVADCRRAGMDISLDIYNWSPFSLFSMLPDSKEMSFSGLLRIGGGGYPIALFTKDKDGPCLKLGLAAYMADPVLTQTISAHIYDLNKNPETDFIAFQQVVAARCARQQAVAENDIADAFDSRRKALVKPPVGLPK